MVEDGRGTPETQRVRHPDALATLDAFDTTFLPQLRRFSNILPGQPRLSGERLHAKYAAFSRAALSSFVGLPGMKAELDAIAEGETSRFTESDRIQMRKASFADTFSRTIWYEGADYAEVVYKKFKIGVTPAFPTEEIVRITHNRPSIGYTRGLIIDMQEGEYKLTAHTAGNNTVGTLATAVFKDTKGLITAATVDVKAIEGIM